MNIIIIITASADSAAGKYAIETLVAGCLLEYEIRLIIATALDLHSTDDLALVNIIAAPEMFNISKIKALTPDYIPALNHKTTTLTIDAIGDQEIKDWMSWADYKVIK